MPVHTNRIQLGNWVVTSPVDYRQHMGGEAGHEMGWWPKKKPGWGHNAAWICAWTMFTVATIYKGFRTVVLVAGFVPFFPSVCKWDFEIHWYSVVDGSSVKPTSPELFSLGVLRAGKHLRWKAWEGLGTAQTSVWAALPCCKGARCIPKEPGQPFEFFAVPFILALSSFAEVKTL